MPERVSETGAEIDPYITSRKMWYCPDRDNFDANSGYKFEAANWPLSGYFNWAGIMFPNGLKTKYPQAYAVSPMWYNAYYPLAQDIMRGYWTDPVNGVLNDERVAHMENGRLARSNAVRHDASVSSQKYFCAVTATGVLNGYTFPGSINYGSSYCYHVVPPQPFAEYSSNIVETFMP